MLGREPGLLCALDSLGPGAYGILFEVGDETEVGQAIRELEAVLGEG